MARPEMVLACVLAVAACEGAPGRGGLRAFEHYEVDVEITDQPDLNSRIPQRALMFQFFGRGVSSPERCASFEGATARFSGVPLQITSPGGWVKNRVPTNTAPGETVNLDHCGHPFIEILFPEPKGEPQNGTLEIEREGSRFTVPISHAFGEPQLSLVSAAPEQVILRAEGFLSRPALEELSVHFSPTNASSAARVAVEKRWLTDDGMLELVLPPNSHPPGRGPSGSLSVVVNLGSEPVACVGFLRCIARSRVVRSFWLDGPQP